MFAIVLFLFAVFSGSPLSARCCFCLGGSTPFFLLGLFSGSPLCSSMAAAGSRLSPRSDRGSPRSEAINIIFHFPSGEELEPMRGYMSWTPRDAYGALATALALDSPDALALDRPEDAEARYDFLIGPEYWTPPCWRLLGAGASIEAVDNLTTWHPNSSISVICIAVDDGDGEQVGRRCRRAPRLGMCHSCMRNRYLWVAHTVDDLVDMAGDNPPTMPWASAEMRECATLLNLLARDLAGDTTICLCRQCGAWVLNGGSGLSPFMRHILQEGYIHAVGGIEEVD
jgi:hypothetical protein